MPINGQSSLSFFPPPTAYQPLYPFPSAPSMDQKGDPEVAMNNYRMLVEERTISRRYQEFMNRLGKYHVVIIADDSGSMNERPDLQSNSRWEDLLQMIKLVVEGSAAFDPDGIDVYFLNRGYEERKPDSGLVERKLDSRLEGLKDPRVLEDFKYPPTKSDLTPLVEVMDGVMKQVSDKPTLLVIATDGHPSDIVVNGYPKDGQEAFKELMKERENNKVLREKCPLSFVMCTDEKEIVEFYDQMKEKDGYHHVEVTETYDKEKREIMEEFHKESFTKADHLIKILLGPIVPEIGLMDKPKSSCCLIL